MTGSQERIDKWEIVNAKALLKFDKLIHFVDNANANAYDCFINNKGFL